MSRAWFVAPLYVVGPPGTFGRRDAEGFYACAADRARRFHRRRKAMRVCGRGRHPAYALLQGAIHAQTFAAVQAGARWPTDHWTRWVDAVEGV